MWLPHRYHNPYDNIGDLADHFFTRCLKEQVTPYVVTKKTVFKWQEWVSTPLSFSSFFSLDRASMLPTAAVGHAGGGWLVGWARKGDPLPLRRECGMVHAHLPACMLATPAVFCWRLTVRSSG